MTNPQDRDKHLIETTVSSELVYQGDFLHVKHDVVQLPNGKTAMREHIIHPGAVVIIPILDNGEVLLERQYRYPLSQVFIEFPAGKLDAGEAPLACGKRELLEETGYTASEWAYAGKMHIAIAYTNEVIHIYFAKNLTAGKQKLDSEEFLDVFSAKPEQVLAWSRDGAITDSKTLTCALWLQNYLSGQWPLEWVKD
ncbi:MAG: NUDIX hydrolase [Cytophagales bacterium]|nr:NUDIX hydrolase [Cytophagales bacterium]